MVRAVGVGGQRAAEIGRGEGGHLVGDAELDGGVVEIAHRRAEPGHQHRMGGRGSNRECRSRRGETKNTCRFAPSSCDDRDQPRDDAQLVGERVAGRERVVIAGAPRQRASVTCACRSSERLVTRGMLVLEQIGARRPVIRPRSAVMPVGRAEQGARVVEQRRSARSVVTPYWIARPPGEDRRLLPEALMQVSVALPLPDWSRSPIRPPQPEVAPSGSTPARSSAGRCG